MVVAFYSNTSESSNSASVSTPSVSSSPSAENCSREIEVSDIVVIFFASLIEVLPPDQDFATSFNYVSLIEVAVPVPVLYLGTWYCTRELGRRAGHEAVNGVQ